MPVPPIHMQSRRTGSALRRSLILYCTCVPVKLGPVVPALGSAWRESPDPAVAVGEGLLGAPFILKYGGTAVVSACGLSRQQLVDAGLQMSPVFGRCARRSESPQGRATGLR